MSYFSPNIPANKHCFFDRLGGISQGLYASRNTAFASQDNEQNIITNLTLCAQQFGLGYNNIAMLHEGISNKAVFITTPTIYQIDADGMVTNKAGILLSLYTADCCPVLFYDKANHVIGAAHAGWRGALNGILENTLDLMLQHGAQKSSLAVALGPCLQNKSFECRQDMYLQFISLNLVHESNAASFLLHVNQHALAFIFDHLQRLMQLLAAIATLASEDVAGSARRMYADENRLILFPFAFYKGHVLKSAAGLAERN